MKNLVKNIVLATIIGVAMLAVPSQVKADDMRVTKTGFRGEYKEGYMTQETDVKGADFSLSYYKNDTPQTEITYFKVVDENTVKLVGWKSNDDYNSISLESNFLKYNGVQYKNIIIGSLAGDKELEEVDLIGFKNTELTKNCFKNCKKLEAITGLHDIKVIPEGAFKNCSSLVEITLRNGHTLKTIEKSAFEGCKSLREFWFISSKFDSKESAQKWLKSHKITVKDKAFSTNKKVLTIFVPTDVCTYKYGIYSVSDAFKFQTSQEKSGLRCHVSYIKK